MDVADDVRSGDVQDLVTALELLEVLQRQVVALQHRSHGAIRNHHASRECCTEIGCRRRGITEIGRGWRPEIGR